MMQTTVTESENQTKVWEYLKDKTKLIRYVLSHNPDLIYPRDKKQISNECKRIANYDFDEEVLNRIIRMEVPKSQRIGSERESIYREYFRK